MRGYFDHEQLDVYQLARAFNRDVQALLTELLRGCAESKDNLRRAGMSITRNIAEGSGKWRIADKVNFYRTAHGSTTEAAAALDELVDYGLISVARVAPLREKLTRIAAMLIAMIKSVEALSGTPGR